ncbi:MAG: NAD(P)-dependent alcohol dehydrogenase [Anaerolineae bacterium]
MKAIVCTEYGPPDLLKLKEVEKPTPGDDQVLVQVHAASVTYSILMLVRGEPFVGRLMGMGLLKPKDRIPGADIAGRVEAVGRNVTRFQPGDEVYGDLSNNGRGGFAEYVCAPESTLARRPANVSFAEAAAVPEAALVALQALQKGGVRPGQKVLIVGASGGIGTFAVQIAKHFGAEVTGVCSARNVELVRSLGADHVVDYTREDFVTAGQHYDLIVATAGYRSILDYRRALSPQGIYVSTGGAMAQTFQALLLGPFLSMAGDKKLGAMLVEPNKDLDFLTELIEAGKLKPVVDRQYPLSEAAQALGYYAGGHARGKVVLTVEHEGS